MATFPIYPGGRINEFDTTGDTKIWNPIYFEPINTLTRPAFIPESKYDKIYRSYFLDRIKDNISCRIIYRSLASVQDRVSKPWTKENRRHKGFVNIKNKAKPASLLLALIINI